MEHGNRARPKDSVHIGAAGEVVHNVVADNGRAPYWWLVLAGLHVQCGRGDPDEHEEHSPGRETMRPTPAVHVAYRTRAASREWPCRLGPWQVGIAGPPRRA